MNRGIAFLGGWILCLCMHSIASIATVKGDVASNSLEFTNIRRVQLEKGDSGTTLVLDENIACAYGLPYRKLPTFDGFYGYALLKLDSIKTSTAFAIHLKYQETYIFMRSQVVGTKDGGMQLSLVGRVDDRTIDEENAYDSLYAMKLWSIPAFSFFRFPSMNKTFRRCFDGNFLERLSRPDLSPPLFPLKLWRKEEHDDITLYFDDAASLVGMECNGTLASTPELVVTKPKLLHELCSGWEYFGFVFDKITGTHGADNRLIGRSVHIAEFSMSPLSDDELRRKTIFIDDYAKKNPKVSRRNAKRTTNGEKREQKTP